MQTTPYEFNYMIHMDALEEYTASGKRVGSLNVVCDGTGFQMVSVIRIGGGNPTGQEIYTNFERSWVSWAGDPYRAFMDQARNNLGQVRKELIARGVHCEFTATEQHHQLVRCERHGGIWKDIWK